MEYPVKYFHSNLKIAFLIVVFFFFFPIATKLEGEENLTSHAKKGVFLNLKRLC